MLGTWLETAYQDSKNNNKTVLYLKEEIKLLKATELVLSMKMEQLQNQLKGENEKKKLEENIRFMFMQAFHPPDIVQVKKLIVSPEEWDGNIWDDPDGSKLRKADSLLPSDSYEHELRPITKANAVGPQQLTKFTTDTGAQISILMQQDAEKLGVQLGQHRVKTTAVNGASFIHQTKSLVNNNLLS